jgi:SPP1 gp7 family putative phage head morphogenesis protein
VAREDAILRAGRRALSVNDRLRNDAIRHSIFLERLKTGQADRIVGFLNRDVYPDLLARVESRLSNISSRGYTASVESNRRLAGLRDAIGGIVEGGMARGYARTAEAMTGVATTEAEFQLATMSRHLPDVVAKRATFVMPSSSLLRSLVETNPMHGHLLKDWFDNLAVTTQSKVMQSLTIGITQGESVSDLVRRLRGTRANNFTDGVLNESRRNVESIVRTAVNHFSTQARETTYQENEDMVKSVQFVATLDTRTTPICRSNDGKVFPVGEGPRPPLHFGCRSTTVPVLKSWRELGIDLDDMEPAGRASMNGVVPASTTYAEWLKGQSAEVQDEVLGPTRGALYRSGALTIDKFADERGRQLTLAELRQKHNLPVERPARATRTTRTATETPTTPPSTPTPTRARSRSAASDLVTVQQATPTPPSTPETRIPARRPSTTRGIPDNELTPEQLERRVRRRELAARQRAEIPTSTEATSTEVQYRERVVVDRTSFGRQTPVEHVPGSFSEAFPQVTPERFAAAAIPDANGVFASPPKFAIYRKDETTSGIKFNEFRVSAESAKGSEMIRSLAVDMDDKMYVYNEFFKLVDAEKGSGFALFDQQVQESRKLGVKYFKVDAAGSGTGTDEKARGFNGYYTWARFGYDGLLPPNALSKLKGTTHEKAKRISDLMSTPEGRAYWQKHGTSWEGKFDLTPGSYSMRTLDAYREERRLAKLSGTK